MQQPPATGSRRDRIPVNLEDPLQMQAILEQHLRNRAGANPIVQECRIDNLRRRDGSRGTVQYTLRLQDPSTGETREQIVTGLLYGGDRTRRVWEVIQQAQERRPVVAGSGTLDPFAFIPELEMLLQVFPYDHRLPALAMLMGEPPAWLTPSLLQEFGPGAWQLTSWRPEVVQYRADMRAIVQIDVSATDQTTSRVETHRVYAKVYRDADEAAASYRAQDALHHATRTNLTGLTVATPIPIAAHLNTVITTRVAGVPLSRIMRRGESVDAAVRSTARAVAAFHQLDIPAPVRSSDDEIAQLRTGAASLLEARPDLSHLVDELVVAISTALVNAPTGLLHGDLKPDHILLDRDQIGLLDFDFLAAADPIIDVAHLIAFFAGPMERGRKQGADVEKVARVFVDEYFKHVPASWRDRLRAYHAVTSLHKAVGLVRRGGDRRSQTIEAILIEGWSYLDGRIGDTTAPTFKRRLTRLASP